MKELIFILMMIVGISTAKAQTDFMDQGGTTALEKGHFQLNIGSGYTTWGIPVYGGVEYAFNEDITLGGFASYSSYSESVFNAKWKHNVFSIFASGNMHVNRLLKFDENVDLYAGLSFGFNSISTKAESNITPGATYSGNDHSGALFAIQAGARYYFTNQLGVQAEVIIGNMNGVHAGLTFRLQ